MKLSKFMVTRMGIEAMLSDCQTGGYNLEGSQANTQRLTNLILLIAIAYTASCYHGKFIEKSGYKNYICRLTEPKRKYKRHSNFWVGMYGYFWRLAGDYLFEALLKIL